MRILPARSRKEDKDRKCNKNKKMHNYKVEDVASNGRGQAKEKKYSM